MDPKNTLLVGLKGSVLAFEKTTGQRLWQAALKSGMGDGFVSVFADETRVYAHTHGELFCLDLATGRVLWHDGLTGLGYGIATLASPGSLAIDGFAAAAEKRRRDEAAAAASHASSS